MALDSKSQWRSKETRMARSSIPKSTLSAKTRNELEQAAAKVMKNAHAPYSNFHVGAAILLTNGKIFSGCNVENASYGMTKLRGAHGDFFGRRRIRPED